MKKVPPRPMINRSNRKRSFLAFGATALLAVAATAQVATIDSRSYAEQLAACQSGASHQARDSCTREVHAAQAARQRGQLGSQEAYMANALARCDAYRVEEDANACRARVMGQGQISGSVANGGLLRQYEYTVPGEPALPAPMPASTMGAGSAGGPTAIAAQPLPPLSPASPAQPRLSPDHPAARTALPAAPMDPVSSQPSLPAFPMYQK